VDFAMAAISSTVSGQPRRCGLGHLKKRGKSRQNQMQVRASIAQHICVSFHIHTLNFPHAHFSPRITRRGCGCVIASILCTLTRRLHRNTSLFDADENCRVAFKSEKVKCAFLKPSAAHHKLQTTDQKPRTTNRKPTTRSESP
jgi:hypothetical protein